jgi:hypothetical protein
MTAPSMRLSSENLAVLVPQAAWLLDGYTFMTVR